MGQSWASLGFLQMPPRLGCRSLGSAAVNTCLPINNQLYTMPCKTTAAKWPHIHIFICLGHCCRAQTLLRMFWKFLTKLNILLPYDPAIELLDIYPKELKRFVYTKICTWIFIAVLLTISNIWKQSRCPSVGEWIKKQKTKTKNCGISRQ